MASGNESVKVEKKSIEMYYSELFNKNVQLKTPFIIIKLVL